MAKFVSFLRGINVSGKNKILMQDLKLWYNELHLENIETYIQSGNVIFDSKEEVSLEKCIQDKLEIATSFKIPVFIKSSKELDFIIKQNPFISPTTTIEIEKLHITFLSEVPSIENLAKIKNVITNDEFEIVGKTIYLYCKNGYGTTKLTNTFFENKLNTIATTRNWRTILQLHKMML